MNISKMVLAIAVLVALAGCVSTVDLSTDWTGKHSTDLLASWGTPIETVQRPDGVLVYVYYIGILGQQIYPATQPGAIFTKYEFFVDKDGMIKALSKDAAAGSRGTANGWYDVAPQSENTYWIHFQTDLNTSKPTEAALLCACEVTIRNGFKYFVIKQTNTGMAAIHSGADIETGYIEITIECFSERPDTGSVIDAADMQWQLREKYEPRCCPEWMKRGGFRWP
jgi:hypothetical protein